MLIAMTGDNHITANRNSSQLNELVNAADCASTLIIAGDMGEGLRSTFGGKQLSYSTLMSTHQDTMYVMGNHDLYSDAELVTPARAMIEHRRQLYPCAAQSLEKTWEDTETFYLRGNNGKLDHAFVGTIGFPDFMHPELLYPRQYYNVERNSRTIDPEHIQLGGKWSDWTDKCNRAFECRLRKAVKYAEYIVITTHYPCFSSHCRMNTSDPLWPYFYNWSLGQIILKVVEENPGKKFWVLAGHAHEYCQGKFAFHDGVLTHGLRTTYHRQDLILFDTEIVGKSKILTFDKEDR